MSLRLFGYGCLTVICLAILSTAGTIAWWAGDRRLPVHVKSTTILTPQVRPGGKLMIRQEIDYTRDCAAHVDRAVYDSDTHRDFLPDIDYERPPLGLGARVITFEVEVPDFFTPGPATYRAMPVYYCNPLQKYYWPITRPETIINFVIN